MRGLWCLLVALAAAGCGAQAPAEPVAAPRAAEPQRVELGWREQYPAKGPQLRFHVESLQVRADGWSAEVAVENATAIPFELGRRPTELRFGLMLFESGSLEELEAGSRAGTLPSIRRADSIEPPPPLVLAPGRKWRATLSARGSLADGSYVRVSFGTFVAVGKPPAEMESVVVWITDKSYRL